MGEPPLDSDGRLTHELPCIRCGYVLRGLLPSDACPECGAAVADAIRDDPLAIASPEWRRRVRSGLLVLMVVIAIGYGIPYGRLVASFVVNRSNPTLWNAVFVTTFVAALLLTWVEFTAVWRVTRDPGVASLQSAKLRRWVRVSVLVGTIGATLPTAMWSIGYGASGSNLATVLLYALTNVAGATGSIASALSAVLLVHLLGMWQPRRDRARSRTRAFAVVLGWSATAGACVHALIGLVRVVRWSWASLAASPLPASG